jgi:hypothetical protein
MVSRAWPQRGRVDLFGKEETVSLTNVWLRTLDDELIRADQIVGIDTHYTPALVGKPACWLLDVFLVTALGSGRRDGRAISTGHRTLIHTFQAPTDAPAPSPGCWPNSTPSTPPE